MQKKWTRTQNIFQQREVSNQIDTLPVAIYRVGYNPNLGFYLQMEQEQFKFPEKMYGLTTGFVERVVRTYQATNDNLGVLLTGLRGTGKTVTCEKICEALGLPVIIIDHFSEGLVEYITTIHEECILFFDEFEKTFPHQYNADSKLLPIMDGAASGKTRKVFLLTTNEMNIDQNLMQRPGRIRYVKKFVNLSPAIIKEIVEDRLKNKDMINEVSEFLAQLEIITIDIVCSVIEEVNIHNEIPEIFADVFNVKKLKNLFSVHEVTNETDPLTNTAVEKMIKDSCRIEPIGFTPENVESYLDHYFKVDGKTIGVIADVKADDLIMVMPLDIYQDDEMSVDDKEKHLKTIKIRQRPGLNITFAGARTWWD